MNNKLLNYKKNVNCCIYNLKKKLINFSVLKIFKIYIGCY